MPQIDPRQSELSAIAEHLTEQSRAILELSISRARSKSTMTGNKVLDHALYNTPLSTSRKINIVGLSGSDANLRKIAIKECLKRAESILVNLDDLAPGKTTYGFAWRTDNSGASGLQPDQIAEGRFETLPLRDWASRRSTSAHDVMASNTGAPFVTAAERRIFVVAHAAPLHDAARLVRMHIEGTTPDKLARRLSDMIVESFERTAGSVLSINFISCGLLGIGDAPEDEDNFVGQFCRTLHACFGETEIQLDVSASPYVLSYSPQSFEKRRLIDAFDPASTENRATMSNNGRLNKLRWRGLTGRDGESADWHWHAVGPMTAAPEGDAIRRWFEDPHHRTHLNQSAVERLNHYHYRLQRVDEQFFRCLRHAGAVADDALLISFARTKRMQTIDGVAITDLYGWAQQADKSRSDMLFSRVWDRLTGPAVFPDADETARRRYFSVNGRLGYDGKRWLTGMQIEGRHRLAQIREPELLAIDLVELARLGVAGAAEKLGD